MVKKVNEDAIAIKKLLAKGYTQVKICRILGLKKTKSQLLGQNSNKEWNNKTHKTWRKI